MIRLKRPVCGNLILVPEQETVFYIHVLLLLVSSQHRADQTKSYNLTAGSCCYASARYSRLNESHSFSCVDAEANVSPLPATASNSWLRSRCKRSCNSASCTQTPVHHSWSISTPGRETWTHSAQSTVCCLLTMSEPMPGLSGSCSCVRRGGKNVTFSACFFFFKGPSQKFTEAQ